MAISENQRKLLEQYDRAEEDLPPKVATAVEQTLLQLNSGEVRAAECINGCWEAQTFVQRAIALFFKSAKPQPYEKAYDKIPLKFSGWESADFQQQQLRVVPGAIVRFGAYIAPQTVVMNGFINVGAYIGAGTMVDSFATIGSCAQIGARCHIAAGAVIGGVLEPIGARPVIIEDDCLIGANASVVEGVIVRKGATIAMGTHVGASTRIINRATGAVSFGEIPAGALAVPGSYLSSNGVSIACVVLVKETSRGNVVNPQLRDS